MKILSSILLFLSFTCSLLGQENPVRWHYKAEKLSANEYNLVFEADIQSEWFMYSQYLASDDGPVRTSFDFTATKGIDLVGKNEESGHIYKAFDSVFGMELIKFSEKAIFTQKIKVNGNIKEVNGSVTYMCCDGAVCLPPRDIPFKISL
jgi:Disulphide bond corrector protein DsbC